MKCPYCGDLDNRVIDSRISQGGEVTRRRRECSRCTKRYTTYERVEESLPTVVMSDGRREPFDHGKLLAALKKTCENRPVSASHVESIADGIERELAESSEKEVSSATIGDRAIARLRDVDEVACVRFASMYRPFRDIQEFIDEMSVLLGGKGDRARGA